jgi:hypothetical protein
MPTTAIKVDLPIEREYWNMLRLVRVAALLTFGVMIADVRAGSEDLDKIDPVMGYWEGEWNDEMSGAQGFCSARIVGQAKLSFRCLFEAEVDGAAAEFEFPLKAESAENLEFVGKIDLGDERGGEADYKYTVKEGKLTGTVSNDSVKVAITMERVYRKPPTLGAKAPEGAKVIFDGTSLDNFTKTDGKPAKWRLVEGGAMQVAPGGGNSIRRFTSSSERLTCPACVVRPAGTAAFMSEAISKFKCSIVLASPLAITKLVAFTRSPFPRKTLHYRQANGKHTTSRIRPRRPIARARSRRRAK